MKIDWIESGVLAASSMPFNANDIRSLHQQGIRAMVSLTTYPLTDLGDISADLLTELDICYLHAPIRDHFPPDPALTKDILDFTDRMKAQQRPVFIHCHAGVGRTGTILHAYFLAQGLSLVEAAARVKSRRIACILLSDRQRAFLKEFAQALKPNP
jgi:atypical dual specificity phosphatase